MRRGRQTLVLFAILVGLSQASYQTADAQIEFFKQLFGGNSTPKQPARFDGLRNLTDALTAADQGDIEKSIELTKAAFRSGGATGQESIIASQYLGRLIRSWAAQDVPPEKVAGVLLDVVLPLQPTPSIFPYNDTQRTQQFVYQLIEQERVVPVPDSMARELVSWSVRGKRLQQLKERVRAVSESPNVTVSILPLTIQLAIAEKDIAAASRDLNILAREAAKVNDVPTLEWFWQAVQASQRNDETSPAGLKLFEAILDRFDELGLVQSALRVNSPAMRVQIARRHIRAGRMADAEKQIRLATEAKFAGFNGDYADHVRSTIRQQSAVIWLDAGKIETALELLAIDESPSANRYYEGFNTPLYLGVALQQLPAEKRFEILRTWTMGGISNGSLRHMTDFVPWDSDLRERPSSLPIAGLMRDTYSTAWHYLITAKELGKIDGVVAELTKLEARSTEVEAFLTLAMMVRDDAEGSAASARHIGLTSAQLRNLLHDISSNVPSFEKARTMAYPWLAMVVAMEAAARPELRADAEVLLERLIDYTHRMQWDRPRAHVRLALVELIRSKASQASEKAEANLDSRSRVAGVDRSQLHSDWSGLVPKHWTPIGFESAVQHGRGSVPEIWCAHDNYIEHLTGMAESDLSFIYPLIGPFDFSFECRENNWSEGGAGYGGLRFQINGYSNSATLVGKGNSGFEGGGALSTLFHRGPWNRYRIRNDGERVQYFANNQILYEDRFAKSAPWLTLYADRGRTPTFRNLKIDGMPLIPRQVELVTNDRLRGWVATYFNESKGEALRAPYRYLLTKTDSDGKPVVEEVVQSREDEVSTFSSGLDWYVNNGELRSPNQIQFWPSVRDSWLTYQRPLLQNEQIRFEYFHDESQFDVSPTIGRVVYVMENNQVRRLPISDGEFRLSEVTIRSTKAADKAHQGDASKYQGPVVGWNSIEISRAEHKVVIRLNGKEIVSDTVEAGCDWRLGFHHDAALHQSRIRNVVLTGDWPEKFTPAIRDAIEKPEPQQRPTDSRYLTSTIGEERFADNAYDVYSRAASLDAEPRFDFLHHWVMPGPTHSTLRLAGAFTPTNPAPSVIDANPIDVAIAQPRGEADHKAVQLGGTFVSPAIVLVLTAAELNRLDALSSEVMMIDTQSDQNLAHQKSAMLGIISLVQGQPIQVNSSIWDCYRYISDEPPELSYRWCDVALASLAIQEPTTRQAAFELLDHIQRRQLNRNKNGSAEFNLAVRQLHGFALYLRSGGAPTLFGTQPSTKQWRYVSQASAKSRGSGYPIASVDSLCGDLAIRGGHEFDMVYFQSPLRGDFEVTCRVTHLDYRETMFLAAGVINGLKYDHKSAKVLGVRTASQEVPIVPPLTTKVVRGMDYKVVVQDGSYSSFINGQPLYSAKISRDADPWLAVVGVGGQSLRNARELRINGHPEIPTEIDLLGDPKLSNWIVDYYGNSIGDTPFEWQLTNGELVCPQSNLRDYRRGLFKLENIARYHRPMLEDGEITYEFYYESTTHVVMPSNDQPFVGNRERPRVTFQGQTIVHPALDRMICLLEEDGVKIHWLTDGKFDRTGLLPNNVSFEVDRGPRKLPLKDKSWNAVSLKTKGDTLRIELNGELVFSRPIDPTNSRHFGLFHFANESAVRVRNVKYRGEWPKVLPSNAEQELVTGFQRVTSFSSNEATNTIKYDFSGKNFDAKRFGYDWNNEAAAHIQPSEVGLQFLQKAGEQKPQTAGVHPRLKLKGDFEVILNYENLKTVSSKDGWGSGISFKVSVQDGDEIGIEARSQNGIDSLRLASRTVTPFNESIYRDEGLRRFTASARLRLVRKGTVLYAFVKDAMGGDERLIAYRAIGTGDINRVSIRADSSDKVCGTEFLLKNLSIRATEIFHEN